MARLVDEFAEEERRQEALQRAYLFLNFRRTDSAVISHEGEVVAGIPAETWNIATECAWRIGIDWSIDGKILQEEGLASAIYEIATTLHQHRESGVSVMRQKPNDGPLAFNRTWMAAPIDDGFGRWEAFFAWYPVRMVTNEWAWFRWVRRRPSDDNWSYGGYAYAWPI